MKLCTLMLLAALAFQVLAIQGQHRPQASWQAEGAFARQMLFAAGLVRRVASAKPESSGKARLLQVFAAACQGAGTAQSELEYILAEAMDPLDCALLQQESRLYDIRAYLTASECLLVPGKSAAQALRLFQSLQALSALGASGLFLQADLTGLLSDELRLCLAREAGDEHLALFSKRREP
ncbi:MAG: hypothetical protein J5846_09945 [Desulfovibrio sp.]|nr:hypothetical protein [Desulfovibrio sp.]